MRGFPYRCYPTGWFQVAWSDDLAPGDVAPLRYFGRDLVAFREAGGQARVLDAHCPHLGAHLGHGGVVEGDVIRCPFHGWTFDGHGTNREIPYAARPNAAQKLACWPVREVNGGISVWYDDADRPPAWEPPIIPEWGRGDYWNSPELRQRHPKVRLVPQMLVENLVDAAHQQYVHKAHEPTDIVRVEADGPFFHVWNRVLVGAGKESTWLTPSGAYEAEMNTQAWGMGFVIGRFEGQDGAIHLQSITPIDEEYCDLRLTLLIKASELDPDTGEPNRRAKTRFAFLVRNLEADFPIWEHMRYVARAPFAGFEVKPYGAMRRWARQFYPDAAGDAEVVVPAEDPTYVG